MSVQTGIAPQELLALDGEMFDALEQAVDEHWSASLELQASTVELLHAQLLAFLRANFPKARIPSEPVTIPRPAQARPEEPERAGARLSVAELALLPGLTAELRGAEQA